MGKYSRLGKNTLLVFIGSAGAKLIGLLMLPFYTRWLSVEDYGTTDIINVYITLLLGVATACISESVFVFPKGQPREKQRSYFSSGLFFSLISLSVTAVFFQGVRTFFEYREISNSFTTNTWLIYGLLAATFLQRYVQQFTRSIDKMVVYSITGIVLTGCTALFSFLIIPHRGVYGYVLAMILANFTAAIYAFLFSGSFRYLNFRSIRKGPCIEMLKFSVPLIPNGVMWWLVSALNRPMMESYLGMNSVGIFAVANKFPGILAVVFSVFITSWQISVMEEFGKEGYSNFYNKMLRLTVFGLMSLFFIISLSSKLIVQIFVTADFYEAWKYIPVLTLGVIFSNIAGFAGCNFSATRESKYFFYSSIWGAIAAVGFNFILIPKFGIMGAAVSILMSFAVMAAARIMYAWKYVKIQNPKWFLIILSVGIATIVVMLTVQFIWLKGLLIVFFLLIFMGMNMGLKDDFLKLYQKIKSRRWNVH